MVLNSTTSLAYAKGHGTGNDFVLLLDADGQLPQSVGFGPQLVKALCDRRFGIGGDGVLRAVRTTVPTELDAEAAAFAGRAEWFMDYRNHDGSTALMCGNGIRVFARFLAAEGLLDSGRHPIGTRGGVMVVSVPDDPTHDVSVDLGTAEFGTEILVVRPLEPINGPTTYDAVAAHVPNPHAVAVLPPGVTLADVGSLAKAPEVLPARAFPDGVNVEFVELRGHLHVGMRVHERGSGETLSCGTGAAAVAAVGARDLPRPTTVRVDVPGGTVHVTIDADEHLHLAGPAVLVASGVADLEAVERD